MDQRIVHRLLDNCYKAHDECKSEDWKLFWLNTAEKISKKSQAVLKIGKEAFYKQLQLNIEDAYEYTSKVMTKNMMNLKM